MVKQKIEKRKVLGTAVTKIEGTCRGLEPWCWRLSTPSSQPRRYDAWQLSSSSSSSSSHQVLDQRPVPRINCLVPPPFPWATRISFSGFCRVHELKLDVRGWRNNIPITCSFLLSLATLISFSQFFHASSYLLVIPDKAVMKLICSASKYLLILYW